MTTNNIRAGNFLPLKNQNEVTVEATPNTFEMDGLFKQEDIDNRHYIMGQCLSCKEWSQWDKRSGRWHCTYCGSAKYDMRGARSIRTWLATKHLKTTKSRKKQA